MIKQPNNDSRKYKEIKKTVKYDCVFYTNLYKTYEII